MTKLTDPILVQAVHILKIKGKPNLTEYYIDKKLAEERAEFFRKLFKVVNVETIQASFISRISS